MLGCQGARALLQPAGGDASPGTGSACRALVDVSILGAAPRSCRAVASVSSFRTETARRLKGAVGHSATHTTGLPGRTTTKSSPP
jgi:hypothetical protein